MKYYLIGFLFLLNNIFCFGHFRLPALVGNGMILQRNEPLKIWGWANPNTPVEISFLGKKYKNRAKADSTWCIVLPSFKKGGPFKMTIENNNTTIVLNDIYIGDVYLCSGQSNMETTIQRLQDKYPIVYQETENNKIRQFYVPRNYNFIKKNNDFLNAHWTTFEGENKNKFSGIAYFIAQKILEKEDVAIGFLNCALGGSPAQAWVGEEYLQNFSDYKEWLFNSKIPEFVNNIEINNKITTQNWYQNLRPSVTLFNSGWHNISLPDTFKNHIPNYSSGVIWLKTEVNINENSILQDPILYLGNILHADSTFINGVFVGNTTYQYPPRKYIVPNNVLKYGKNEILIKVIDTDGQGMIVPDKPYYLWINSSQVFSLNNANWQYKLISQVPNLPKMLEPKWQASGLFNGMINPMLNFNFKSVIWYQGESNTDNPKDYAHLIHSLIANWRIAFNKPNLPFYIVQLPNYGPIVTNNAPFNWAVIRNEQAKLANSKDIHVITTLDLGEYNDIHPANKASVGERIANLLLQKEYGFKNIKADAPSFLKAQQINSNLILQFNNINIANRLTINHFEIGNSSKYFIKVNAILFQNKITIALPQNFNVKYVRYAWSNNPGPINFYNQYDLPCGSFLVELN